MIAERQALRPRHDGPAMRPNVMAVPIACPCETYWLPNTLPVTSPAASRPGIGRPVSSSTWVSASMHRPYPVTGTIIGLITTAWKGGASNGRRSSTPLRKWPSTPAAAPAL